MEYWPEIIPLLEANAYLSQRFIQERTSFRIDEYSQSKNLTTNFYLAYFRKITALEKTLDDAFPETELMRYYFSPLKTKEERPNEILCIGGMLLSIPSNMNAPFTLDALVEYLRVLPKDELLCHFYDSSVMAFVSEPGEPVSDLSDFMARIDGILVNPEDKWNLIDAASNPIPHIEKLRELVCAVANTIASHSVEFAPLLAECRNSFMENEITVTLRMLNIEADIREKSEISVFPSIFMFNGLILAVLSTNVIRIIMGFFVDSIIRSRSLTATTDNHISLVKALSDGTRFKALYSLRDRYSFGQELADEFGGTRNAMYYHLEKLMGMGLIDCKVTEYRMLYTMNKRNVYDKLTALRDFLVGGWTPGDDEGQEDEPQKEKVQR
ncbi:MAG: winged helix-turn-helix transcriptional regulator [Clostridia bacterium]|nr:winged helix-turn-helix transcriptional regulator [Clostridia bacterium]